jgi:hypothetical protein
VKEAGASTAASSVAGEELRSRRQAAVCSFRKFFQTSDIILIAADQASWRSK